MATNKQPETTASANGAEHRGALTTPVVLYVGTNAFANPTGNQNNHFAIPVCLDSKTGVDDRTLTTISMPPSTMRAVSTREQLVRLLQELKPSAVVATQIGEGTTWGHAFTGAEDFARAVLTACPNIPCVVNGYAPDKEAMYRMEHPTDDEGVPRNGPPIFTSRSVPYGGVGGLIASQRRI